MAENLLKKRVSMLDSNIGYADLVVQRLGKKGVNVNKNMVYLTVNGKPCRYKNEISVEVLSVVNEQLEVQQRTKEEFSRLLGV